MARRNATLSLVAALCCLLPPPLHAAPWDKSSRLDRVVTAYDRDHEVTCIGTVEAIKEVTPTTAANQNSVGWHIIVRNDTDKVDVHLGPIWYVPTLEGLIAKGDQVEVFGAYQKAKERHLKKGITYRIWASTVKIDGKEILRLRDASGKPLWSGYTGTAAAQASKDK